MFAFAVVGFFILIIFSAEFFKMWRRETEYRRARAGWNHDVDELSDGAWRGPGPGQRPTTAPGYIATQAAVTAAVGRRTATPVADVHTRIERELRALHRDARTFDKRLRKEAPEVYPGALELAMANDESGPDDEEVRPRTTH